MTDDVLRRLAATIADRKSATADTSYTRKLLDGGPQRCAKKLGEEAVEVVIAATGQDADALRAEAADLIYHLLVVLESRDVKLEEVLDILERRSGVSGLVEKAARAVS